MSKEKLEPITEIKTIEEVLREWEFYQHTHPNSDMIKCIKEYVNHVLDFVADNINADYERHSNGVDEDFIEVFVKRGQFEEFKKMIK